MTHYDEIEHFAGGGRISPQRSATFDTTGTLGIGNNGNLWINKEDKNGTKSWKPTSVKAENFKLLKFLISTENEFYCQIETDLFNLYFSYNYTDEPIKIDYAIYDSNYDSVSEILEQDVTVDTAIEFWNEQWNEDKSKFTPKGDATWQRINDEVLYLLRALKNMQKQGLIRPFVGIPNPEEDPNPEEAPQPKFNIGDRVRMLDKDYIYKNYIDLFRKLGFSDPEKMDREYGNNGDEAIVFGIDAHDFSGKYLYAIKLVTGDDIDFENLIGEEGLELVKRVEEEIPQPKFKVGDKVIWNKMPFMEDFYIFEQPLFNVVKNKWVYKLKDNVDSSPLRVAWEDELTITNVCEADPTKIVSGQVKKFYDSNKTRIEKLNPLISCKIIQALVSLSEYEECGVGSSESLPKAKSDLLSRISKLKV